LFLTKPEEWSNRSMFEATKLFTSNSDEKQLQRFLNLVLLPAVRDNITSYQKLNCHLYDAVKRSMYKPKAFFKGFIFPLVEDCNSREAAIIGSILQKCSINVVYAGAALIKVCDMPYSIGTSYFIKIFISKSYSFP